MSSYVPAAVRRSVVQRAHNLCEYCLTHESDTFYGHQVEHIISEKHRGLTALENLAYACVICNRAKGTDIASIAPRTGQLCRLFNPRADRWADHFALDGPTIRPISDIGEVTVRLLGINDSERILEREELMAVGRYPSPEAFERIRS